MPAPTLAGYYQVTNWATSTATATVYTVPSVVVETGDILVVIGALEVGGNSFSTPAGNGLTYTQRQKPNADDDASHADTQLWTATATGNATFDITATKTGASTCAGLGVFVFRNAALGTPVSAGNEDAGTAPSLDITTVANNSAVVHATVDFNAVDGASRTWRTINSVTPTAGNGGEKTYARNAASYTVFIGYWSDVGTAGSKTTGLSAPTGQEPNSVAIEIQGTATAETNYARPQRFMVPFVGPFGEPTARPLQLFGDASGQDSKALDDAGAGADSATVTAAVPFADTAVGADDAVVAAAVPMADTAAADDGSDLTAVVSFTVADTATGDDALVVLVAATVSPDQALRGVPPMAVSPRSTATQTYGDATTPQGSQAVTLSDDGSATDALAATAAVPLADTAAGADDLTVAAAAPLAETGTATDSLNASVVSGTDAYQASPLIAWMFVSPKASSTQNVGDTTSGLVTLTDTVTGSDSLTVAPAVPLSETASGTDALTGTATASLPETATGDDTVTVSVAAPLAETAAAVDSLSVQVADQADQVQHRSAVPPMAISPRHAAAQTLGSASGPDQFNVSLTEAATADDSLAISVTITLADTAAAVDALSPVAGPLLTELVSAADSLAIAVVLGLTESSTAVDNLFIGGSGIQGNVRPRGDRASGGTVYPRGTPAIIGSGG